MEVLGMSTDRTDNDMVVAVPLEPVLQEGGIMFGVAAKTRHRSGDASEKTHLGERLVSRRNARDR